MTYYNPKGKTFLVTREFTSGLLKGLRYTAMTNVWLPLGYVVYDPVGGGSGYWIVDIKEVE